MHVKTLVCTGMHVKTLVCTAKPSFRSLRHLCFALWRLHTPCLGLLVTSPSSLMQSYHCLEIWATARASLVEKGRWAADMLRVRELVHQTQNNEWGAIAQAGTSSRLPPSLPSCLGADPPTRPPCGVEVVLEGFGASPVYHFLVGQKGRYRGSRCPPLCFPRWPRSPRWPL